MGHSGLAQHAIICDGEAFSCLTNVLPFLSKVHFYLLALLYDGSTSLLLTVRNNMSAVC